MVDKKKMNQFQGLRAVAFMAIFISHARIGPFGALGAWGVSVFLCLSGFLMGYNYLREGKQPKFGLAFVWSKIKRLYPLHIATMMGAILYYAVAFRTPAKELITLAALHTALIHIWIPWAKYYATLNGVAWYLCACAFCYFGFPLILRLLNRCRKRETVRLWIGVLFLMQIVIAFVAGWLGDPEKNEPFSMQWITYYFPVSRFLEFSMGCCLGYLFLSARPSCNHKIKYSGYEVAAWILAALAVVICAVRYTVLGSECVRYALLFTPSTMLLIWLVAKNGGVLSGLLQKPVLVRIGDISAYTFLIHPLAIWFFFLLIPKLWAEVPSIIPATLAFALTVASAHVWMKLEGYWLKKGGK